jgi:hypothetical protein
MTGLVVLLATAALSGQSPDCERFCMSVAPKEGPEGSVFTFKGRHWRPDKRVTIAYGPYCRPDEACPAIAYLGHIRTGPHGGFTFRLRAGAEQDGDPAKGIVSGSGPGFSQRVGRGDRVRTVSRSPRYRVILPG